MADKHVLFFPLAALALTGCLSFAEKPPPSLLTLTPTATLPVGTQRSTASGSAITIAVPSVPQVLQTLRIPVTTSANSIAYLQNAQWVEQPSRLFQHLLSETIAARSSRVVLDPHQSALDPGIRLTGTLQSFGFDVASGKVVVVYDAVLVRGAGDSAETRRFEARAPASAAPQPVAVALNVAANQVAAAVAEWLASR